MRQVADRYRGWRVKIVLDNYGVHFTKRVQELLDGLDGRIELVPLPTYSPHLNPIVLGTAVIVGARNVASHGWGYDNGWTLCLCCLE